MILQPLLRKRTVIQYFGWLFWAFPQKRYSKMDEKQMVPLWIPDFLFPYVLPDALEYLAGICRNEGFKTDCHPFMDI